MRRWTLLLAISLLGLAGGSPAAELTVGVGASVDLGTGSLDLGCADLTVGGTLLAGTGGFSHARDVGIDPTGVLNGGSATLKVAGDWDNAGTFDAGTSTVSFVDGCGLVSAVIAGDTSFAGLSMVTMTGKLYSFESGSTQTVTGLLQLEGASGNRLTIRSTLAGVAAFFVRLGGQAVGFVDVDDNNATGGGAISLPANSVKGPNTPGWLAVVVPALGPLGLALLALSLVWAGCRAMRGSPSGVE